MRRASASWLTSPSTAEAVPPAFAISSTRLSTPPQFASRSPGAVCSLATPAGRTSETTTATPLAASARAVELPMPTGLPQPVISATRDEWGMVFRSWLENLKKFRPTDNAGIIADLLDAAIFDDFKHFFRSSAESHQQPQCFKEMRAIIYIE